MTRADDTQEEGGFFKRFSKRKLAASRPAQKALPETEPEPDQTEPNAVDADYIDALPPVDSIGDGSDIKPFLAHGVPAELRNAALRRVWSATPGVRDYLDPAVDYAWDWNAPGGVPGGGGALSQVRVAQMVKDLIGTPIKAPEQEGLEAQQTEAPDGTADIQEANETVPEQPLPVRLSTSSPAQNDHPLVQRPAAAPPAPRRHGSATPD